MTFQKKYCQLFFLCIFTPIILCANHHQLVAINDINPSIKIECLYATYHNFTGQRIYPAKFYHRCYLLKDVALQLNKVQKELVAKGLGLLIFDAYRPLEAQKKLWSICPDTRYVSDPKKGGRHTRGTTVDLTIIRLSDHEPLDMGCGFDVFTQRAHTSCPDISETAKKNRTLLHTLMKKHGFHPLKTEWWHFDYKTWAECSPLDVTFDDLT